MLNRRQRKIKIQQHNVFFIRYLQINREIACILTWLGVLTLSPTPMAQFSSVFCFHSLAFMIAFKCLTEAQGLTLRVRKSFGTMMYNPGWCWWQPSAESAWPASPLWKLAERHCCKWCARSRRVPSVGENGWMNVQIGLWVEALQMLPAGTLLGKKNSLYAGWRSGTCNLKPSKLNLQVGPVVIVINWAVSFN